MKKERLPDWRTRLSRHIEANRFRPFEWGQHDCALWAASCIEVMTGEDPGSLYRGQYHDAVGALRQLRWIDGVKTPHALALKLVGPTKPWPYAKAGDLVGVNLVELGIGHFDGTGWISVGICFGTSCYFAGTDGLIEVPTKKVAHAYG